MAEMVNALLANLSGPDPLRTLPAVQHNAARAVVNKDTESVYFCLGAPGYAELSTTRKIRLPFWML